MDKSTAYEFFMPKVTLIFKKKERKKIRAAANFKRYQEVFLLVTQSTTFMYLSLKNCTFLFVTQRQVQIFFVTEVAIFVTKIIVKSAAASAAPDTKATVPQGG